MWCAAPSTYSPLTAPRLPAVPAMSGGRPRGPRGNTPEGQHAKRHSLASTCLEPAVGHTAVTVAWRGRADVGFIPSPHTPGSVRLLSPAAATPWKVWGKHLRGPVLKP